MSKMNPVCVPEGLRDLMKSLTKEMLKKKPLNIYEFSANYFESVIPEKEVFKQKNFEAIPSYGTTINKSSTVSLQTQVPLSLLYRIIPEELIELIKGFIKAVLRTNPDNICEFAVQYFNNLKEQLYSTDRLVEYGLYENYLKSTLGFSTNAVEKCTCGQYITRKHRKEKVRSDLGDPKNSTEIRHLDLSTLKLKTVKLTTKNRTEIICESDIKQQQKYISAIVIIQRFYRKILGMRKPKANIKKDIIIKEIVESSNAKVSTELTHREKSSTINENFRDPNILRENKGMCILIQLY